LIRRIYDHMLEEGWLKAGDRVLDSFAGVALGALHAMHNGLHWVGLELEQRFVDVGAGLDCTGISADDWVRFYGRWPRAARLEGRAWCPQCLAEAAKITEGQDDPALLPGPPSASYRRNSGQIPSTLPHHYTGNLDLWRAMRLSGTAVLLQGDSRKLLEVLRGEVEGCVSSPPYADSEQSRDADFVLGPTAVNPSPRPLATRSYYPAAMEAPGQLGTMPEGEFSAAVSSPPFAGCENQGLPKDRTRTSSSPDDHGAAGPDYVVPRGAGQLAGLPPGDFEGVVSSPPFGAAETRDRSPYQGGYVGDMMGRAYTQDRQGETDGNLGGMETRAEDFEAVVSSPPYEAQKPVQDTAFFKEHRAAIGRDPEAPGGTPGDYGDSPGQLGQEQADTFWSAARTIVEQVYAALVPGGHAVWITKRFVRNGEIVPFPDQWRQLCEAVGFVTLHEHHAMLVEDNGTQLGFFEDDHLVTERKSFFRRLAESKGSPRIDWETVWCMEKPEQPALFAGVEVAT